MKRTVLDEFDFNEDQDEEEFETKKERKLSSRELQHLSHLQNVKRSTDKGMIDRGFPRLYSEMEVIGLVKKVADGHQITAFGREHLEKHRPLLRKI